MEPLILKDVAEAVEMHESTISRVTTAKYMHTPRGVFEFRYFFSSHVEAADGTGDVLDRHPRQDQEADFAGKPGESVERQQARGDPVAARAYRSPGARLPNIARACRSRRPTNASALPPARRRISCLKVER